MPEFAEPLREEDVDPDPLRQFAIWFEAAGRAGVRAPEAVVLATASSDGAPSARMVLLKQYDARGFVIFTNYESRKALELDANPRAALLFYWDPLGRQIRIEGPAQRVSVEESAAYVRSRPRGSQLSALASPQSRPIASREALEAQVAELGCSVRGAGAARARGVGRIPCGAGELRVLAAPRGSPPRPARVHAPGRGVGARAVGALRLLGSRHGWSPGSPLMETPLKGAEMADRAQRMKGKAEELKGRAKKETGRSTGRTGTETRGAAEELKGKTRNKVGKARSAIKKATR